MVTFRGNFYIGSSRCNVILDVQGREIKYTVCDVVVCVEYRGDVMLENIPEALATLAIPAKEGDPLFDVGIEVENYVHDSSPIDSPYRASTGVIKVTRYGSAREACIKALEAIRDTPHS